MSKLSVKINSLFQVQFANLNNILTFSCLSFGAQPTILGIEFFTLRLPQGSTNF